ncbi:MAG TPA: hypothetical protein VF514_05870 [Bacteroidota bacterium]
MKQPRGILLFDVPQVFGEIIQIPQVFGEIIQIPSVFGEIIQIPPVFGGTSCIVLTPAE